MEETDGKQNNTNGISFMQISEIARKWGIAGIGFAFAAYVYVDFRDFMKVNLDVLQDVAKSTAVHTETIRNLTQNIEWLIREENSQRKKQTYEYNNNYWKWLKKKIGSHEIPWIIDSFEWGRTPTFSFSMYRSDGQAEG